METQPIERARITFWWPSTGHPVWSDPARTDGKGHWRATYCFTEPFFKALVIRKYRLMRALGATPIAARWACDTECQRQYNCRTSAVWRGDGYETPIGSPMAFFPPEPDFDEDDSEPTETWEEEG